jgi:hypothetical protein
MSHPVTRAELREELSSYATKADLREELALTKAELREELASKRDLQGWAERLIDMFRTEVRSQSEALRMEMRTFRDELAQDLARHVRAANEEMRDWLRGFDDRYKDLPPRVDKLEAKVFAPKRRRRR